MLVTLTEVKDSLGLTGTQDDAYLENLIKTYSNIFEQMTNRSWSAGSTVEKLEQTWGQKRLQVNKALPIKDILSIKVDGNVIDSNDYEVEEANLGFIRIKAGAWQSTGWSRGRSINYWEHGTEYLYEVEYEGPQEAPAGVKQAVIDAVGSASSRRGMDTTISSIKVGDASTKFGHGSTSSSPLASPSLPPSFILAVNQYKQIQII